MTKSKLLAALVLAASLGLGSPALAQTMAPAGSATLSTAAVKALQEALNKQGIAVRADGVLGEATREAIKKFQSQHHLPVTGEPDKATLDKLGVSSGPSQAMSGPRTGGQGMRGKGGMMDCPMMGMMGPGKQGIEDRLASVKAKLKITPEQEEAWKAYGDAVRAIDKRMAGMKESMGAGGMMEKMKGKPAPDVLQMHVQMMQGHVDDLKMLQAATAQLYGSLADGQKKTADGILGMSCAMAPM